MLATAALTLLAVGLLLLFALLVTAKGWDGEDGPKGSD
jgi:hypothetical protein